MAIAIVPKNQLGWTILDDINGAANSTANGIIKTGLDIFKVVSGQDAALQAQQVQLQIAQAQAQQKVLQSQSSAQMWAPLFSALPWVAGGVAALALIATIAKRS